MSKKNIFLDELNSSDITIPSDFIKDNLNTSFWNDFVLNPLLKEKMLTIAKKFHEYLKINVMYEDIYFVGSMANYNWTDFSDIDIHVIYDFSKINKDQELVKNYVDSKKTIWNEKHNIKLKGYNVEVYAQSTTEEFDSAGIYSLLQDKWLSIPKKEKVIIDKSALKAKIFSLANSIERVVSKFKKVDDKILNVVAERLKNKIKRIRQSGLSEKGEFSIENLAFKYLRNNGYIEKLINIMNKSIDNELSLNEGNNNEYDMVSDIVVKEFYEEFDNGEKYIYSLHVGTLINNETNISISNCNRNHTTALCYKFIYWCDLEGEAKVLKVGQSLHDKINDNDIKEFVIKGRRRA